MSDASDTNIEPAPASVSAPDDVVVSAELAALGETPIDDEELRFHRAGADLSADADVVTVATLLAIGTTKPDERPLSEIENRRTWNRVADRLETSGHDVPRSVAGRGVWRAVVAGLAMAAGVALVPQIVPSGPAANAPIDPEARAALEDTGKLARDGLEALGKDYDGDRASSMAAAYRARLEQEREVP